MLPLLLVEVEGEEAKMEQIILQSEHLLVLCGREALAQLVEAADVLRGVVVLEK